MTPPVKGAQVLKGGGGQRRLSRKPKFVVFFFWRGPLSGIKWHQVASSCIKWYQMASSGIK